MRTRYKIDSYQQTYFVIDSFEQLFGLDGVGRNVAQVFDVVVQRREIRRSHSEELLPRSSGQDI